MGHTRINLGLIGLGRLGQLYAEFLAYALPQARLVAEANTNAIRGAILSEGTCGSSPLNDL